MKCYYCENEIPLINEIVYCEVFACRKEIAIPVDDDQGVSYSI